MSFKKLDYRWNLVLILFFAAVVNYMTRDTLSIANTTIAENFHLNAIQMGFLLSAFMWPYALASLPAGWFVDKVGMNKVFLFSVFLWSFAAFLGGIAESFTSLYFVMVLIGIAESPFFIISGKLCQQFFVKKERGMAASVINMGPRVANAVAPIILVFLILLTGWRGMFIIVAVLGFIVGCIWLAVYSKEKSKTTANKIMELENFQVSSIKKRKISYLKLMKHPTMIAMIIGNMGTSYVFWVYLTWFPDYLMKVKHLSLKKTGFIDAIPFMTAIFAVLLGGYISDKLIRKGVSPLKARLIPIVAACLISGFASIPVNYVTNLTVVMILITVSIFAYNMIPGIIWALVGDLSPIEAVGSFGGIQNFANFVGATLAPIGTGLILYFSDGNFNFVFITSGIFCIIGAVSYTFIRRPIKNSEVVL